MRSCRQKLIGAIVLLSLTTLPGVLGAQPYVTDLAVEVVIPDGITPPGSTGSMTVTATNLGPGPAGEPPLGLRDVLVSTEIFFSYYDGVGIAIDFTRVISGECFLNAHFTDPKPGYDPAVIYQVRFDQLNAGESLTCEIEFRINPYLEDDEIETVWDVFATTVDDSDTTNDEVTVVFVTQAAAIPTLSSVGLIVMIAALILAALRLQRRQAVRRHS